MNGWNWAKVPLNKFNEVFVYAVKQMHFLALSAITGLDRGDGFEVIYHLNREGKVLLNLSVVLTHGGSSLDKVVKATVFLKDLNDFAGMNEVYAKHFKSETAPARTTIQVVRIPKDSLVEIEVVAHI